MRRSGELEVRNECLLVQEYVFRGLLPRFSWLLGFCCRRNISCGQRNTGVLTRWRRRMSMIVETPVTIVARMIVEAWWFLQRGAIAFSVIDTNGSNFDEAFMLE